MFSRVSSLLVLMPQLEHALSISSESNDLPQSSLRAALVSRTLKPSSESPSPAWKAFSISELDGYGPAVSVAIRCGGQVRSSPRACAHHCGWVWSWLGQKSV